MGAIAVSIFVSAVAVIGLICFNKKDKKTVQVLPKSNNRRLNLDK